MKKIYNLLFILILSFGAKAQQGLHMGVDGGGGLAFIVWQNSYGGTQYPYAPKGAYTFGYELGYNCTDHFGFQGEINYVHQGQNYSAIDSNVNFTRYIDLNYIRIPLLFKYSAGNYPSRFVFMVGPQLGILTSASIRDNNEGKVTTIDARNRFTPLDLGMMVDVGSEFTLSGNWYLSTCLRFTYGLTDINSSEYRHLDPNSTYHASLNAYGELIVGIHYLWK